MQMIAWIMFCLFASIGLVQCGIWLREMIGRPEKLRVGYHVIPMYDDVEKLEIQLRYALSQIRRRGADGGYVLLVDMGLGEESQKICDKLILGAGEVYICDKSELPEMIEHLDRLQNA